jgi:hypothetical protein
VAQHVLKGSLNTKPERFAKQPAVPSTFSHPGLGPAKAVLNRKQTNKQGTQIIQQKKIMFSDIIKINKTRNWFLRQTK